MSTGVTIAIPTFNRGRALVDTVRLLLELQPRADRILIVDQTADHDPAVQGMLRAWHEAGAIDWVRLPQPSIPHAMNEALLRARTPVVLFMDDDVVPSRSIVGAHAECLAADQSLAAVVGQILQPGEEPAHHERPGDDLEFRFNHDTAVSIANVMAGNLSVVRERALRTGGFDENFSGAAYRFESDFALRLVANGHTIRFEPRATLRHLQLPSGGLRSYGDHRTSASPAHSEGDFYFAFRHRQDKLSYMARRFRRNVFTRWHLRHPWAIPPKLVGELRGLVRAIVSWRRGPRLLTGFEAGAIEAGTATRSS